MQNLGGPSCFFVSSFLGTWPSSAFKKDAADATMDADHRQYMLTRLRPLAEKLGPQGPAAWKWVSLKSHLAQQFNDRHLENQRTEILELFIECLSEQGQLPYKSAPIIPQSATSSSGCASFTPPSSSVPQSYMMEAQLSSRSTPTNASSKSTVDDGFIRITPTTYDGARFSYSWNKEENFVGWHILKRNELLAQVKDNKIWLTFFLESKPKKSYKLEFRTKKKASFDVSLGTKWKDEGEEEADESTIKGVVRRQGEFCFVPSNTIIVCSSNTCSCRTSVQ